MSFQMHNTDPFQVAVTIPGTCMHIYRKRYLKKKTIGIVPHKGYCKNDKHSRVAIKWLKWISHSQQLQIQVLGGSLEISVE
jgi:hypothetical protein